jgi:WD40 repeat protein
MAKKYDSRLIATFEKNKNFPSTVPIKYYIKGQSDLSEGIITNRFGFPNIDYAHNNISKSKDFIAVRSRRRNDETIEIWDIKNAKLHKKILGHSKYINCLCFSPNGQSIASGHSNSENCEIKIWNIQTHHWERSFYGHSAVVTAIHFSPNGEVLVSGSRDDTVRIWEVNSGKLLKTLRGHFAEIRSVSFSPNGTLVASTSGDYLNYDYSVRIWEVATGKLLKTLESHEHDVMNARFSPDGGFIVSCSIDRTIKLWHVETGELLRTFEGHKDWVTNVCFSLDGKLIASASRDGIMKIWNAQISSERILKLEEKRIAKEKAGKLNLNTVNSAKEAVLLKKWSKASDLFRKSKEICISQGWDEGVKYADKMIRAIVSEKELELRRVQEKGQTILEDNNKGDKILLERFKQILYMSNRIDIAMVAKMMEIDIDTLTLKLLRWGQELPIKIEGKEIVVNNIEDFLQSLDEQFSTWVEDEQRKKV